jgi:hypothetical protein
MDAARELAEVIAHAAVVDVGMLPVPTGRLVTCDPFFCAGAEPLAESVDPGCYLVRLHRLVVPGWGRRVGAAELVVRSGGVVASFRQACFALGANARYFVHSGLGSFMDERVRVEFAGRLARFYRDFPEGNYYGDVLESEFKATCDEPADPFDAGYRDMHAYSEAGHARVAMFSSGLGDGTYESHWGLGEDGEVVSLFTNFLVLSRTRGDAA